MEEMNKVESTVGQDHRSTILTLRASSSETWPQLAGEKEMVCQSCGGHTTFSGTLTSTRCPYCVAPIRREDVHVAPGRLPVDGVVPFEVDPMAAKEAIEGWIQERRFVPSKFRRYKHSGSFARVYASCFTYDGHARTAYKGRCGESYTVTIGRGDNSRQESRMRWHETSGTVRTTFTDVCVLANDGFDRDRVRALEPWPTDLAKPISAEYVAGHLCRTYDRDVEQSFVEAKQQIEAHIEIMVRRDMGGDLQEIAFLETTFESLTCKHLLMPMWLLTVLFERKPFQVFVDGVTGEVHGQRPLSKVKVVLAAVGAATAALAMAAGASWTARPS